MLSLRNRIVGPFEEIGRKLFLSQVLHSDSSLTVLEQIVPLIFTALAICGLIAVISRNTELFYSFLGHLARENGIDIPKLCPGLVTRDEPCIIWFSIFRCGRTRRL